MVELFVLVSVLVATVSSVTVGCVSVCVFDDRNKHVLGYFDRHGRLGVKNQSSVCFVILPTSWYLPNRSDGFLRFGSNGYADMCMV